MAASYQTGVASSPTNLLQTLVTWLAAQGWTTDSSIADASGWRAHLHKSGLYVNLRAAVNESVWNYNQGAGYGIGLYLGSGYSGAANWRSQAGGPLATGTANTVGAGIFLTSGAVVAYHFFDDGADHITVVVERIPGVFGYFGWGPSIVKTGYTIDYPYFYGSMGSYYNTSYGVGSNKAGYDVTALTPGSHKPDDMCDFFVRVDAAIFAAQWMGNAITSVAVLNGYTGRRLRCALLQTTFTSAVYVAPNYTNVAARSWSTAFPGVMELVLHLFTEMASTRWSPIGYPPTVFGTLAWQHGYTPGQVIAIAGDNYMVFPYFAVRKAA